MASNWVMEILKDCIEILNTYSSSFLSPEDHLKQYIDSKIFTDVDATFISEIFSGVLRYKSLITVVTSTFYSGIGKGVPLADETCLQVLCYITLFRLDEIGIPNFKRLIRSQDFNKMYKFFKFFLNETSLKTWMKDEWSKLFDITFVETNLLSPLFRLLPELKELLEELQLKVEAKNNPPRIEIPGTKVEEFKLTKPRPRRVPVPEPIPKLEKHNPVPKAIYAAPKEFTKLQEKRVENRKEAETRLMESSKQQYSCANPVKSMRTVQRLEQLRRDEEEKLQFDKYRAMPIPKDVMNSDVPIKLNAATILREGKLFKKREEEIVKKLERLEAGAHDPSKFIVWQNQMRQQDLQENLAAVERRRLEGKLSHEEAILARQNLIKENQRKVDEMKEETKELMARYLNERLEEEQLMKSLVEVVLSGRENAKEAKKKLVAYKAKIVQEVNAESQELMRQALEEAEAEMKKKIELIHQIRAMEAAPISREKMVDFTETAGYRLLNEMSLAELRERLSLLKDQQEAEEEKKRDEILAIKQSKDRMILDTLNVISKHRAEETKARAEQRSSMKTHTDTVKETVLIKDEKLLALKDKVEKKRAERLELQEKSKIKTSESSIKRTGVLIREKNKSEERRWAELEKTKKRMASMHLEGLTNPGQGSRLTEPDGSRLAVSSYPYIVA